MRSAAVILFHIDVAGGGWRLCYGLSFESGTLDVSTVRMLAVARRLPKVLLDETALLAVQLADGGLRILDCLLLILNPNYSLAWSGGADLRSCLRSLLNGFDYTTGLDRHHFVLFHVH